MTKFKKILEFIIAQKLTYMTKFKKILEFIIAFLKFLFNFKSSDSEVTKTAVVYPGRDKGYVQKT